jgi:hypothetical protein
VFWRSVFLHLPIPAAHKIKAAVPSKTFLRTSRLHGVTEEDHTPNVTPVSNPWISVFGVI